MEKYAIAFALALLALGCTGSLPSGRLEGNVTIGPLCPVEPCHLTPQQIAAVYESRQAVIYAQDMRTVARENLSASGTYSFALPPGSYFVAIEPAGIQKLAPREVQVRANETTELNIDIDTGIR